MNLPSLVNFDICSTQGLQRYACLVLGHCLNNCSRTGTMPSLQTPFSFSNKVANHPGICFSCTCRPRSDLPSLIFDDVEPLSDASVLANLLTSACFVLCRTRREGGLLDLWPEKISRQAETALWRECVSLLVDLGLRLEEEDEEELDGGSRLERGRGEVEDDLRRSFADFFGVALDVVRGGGWPGLFPLSSLSW